MSIYKQPWRLVQNKIRGSGGREIDKLRGVSPPLDSSNGSEAWIGSVTRVGNPPPDKPDYGCSEVVLPDGRRLYLHEAIELAPELILGAKHIKKNGHGMGMLIKYLDAQRQYGLQCHPTREWAKKMWGSDYGKEESWYVIGTRDDTAEPAYILLGFKQGVTRADWEKHYRRDDIAALENLCHKIQVKPGEAYFVGGGVPHALGEGCFVIELQEPCDITLGANTWEYARKHWRVSGIDKQTYDERLLGAYIYDGCTPEENLRRWLVPRKLIRSGGWGREEIIIGTAQTSFFSFTELTVNGDTAILSTSHPQVAIVLKGGGALRYDGGEMRVAQGDEIFLPYDVPGLRVSGDATLIMCHPEGVIY